MAVRPGATVPDTILTVAVLLGIAMVGGTGVDVGGKNTAPRVGRSVGRRVGTLLGSAVGEGSTVEGNDVAISDVTLGWIATTWDVLRAVAVRELISGIATSDWKPEIR